MHCPLYVTLSPKPTRNFIRKTLKPFGACLKSVHRWCIGSYGSYLFVTRVSMLFTVLEHLKPLMDYQLYFITPNGLLSMNIYLI